MPRILQAVALPTKSSALRTKALLFFSVLFLLYTFAPRYVGMGHASRYDLTKALVDDHSFVIDKYVENTIDWSFHDGHYYTNKAPGLGFLSAPFYFLLTRTEHLLKIDISDWGFRNLRWTDVCVTALPSVLLSLLLLLFLRHFAPPGADIWLVVFAYAVGTGAFTYSTMMWAHQTAAAFMFASFFFLSVQRRPYGAGFFLGLSVLTEYTCALGIPAFGAYFLWKARQARLPVSSIMKDAGKMAAGGLPWLALFLIYHKSCFGGYLSLANSFGNHAFVEEGKQFGVLGMPSAKVLWQLLLGNRRGLFFIYPVLAFAVPGFCRWLRNPKLRAEALVCLWLFLTFLLFNSSFNGWHGGGSSGPRYLVPILPFLAASLVWVRHGLLFKLATLVSVINVGIIAAVSTGATIEFRLFSEWIYPRLISEKRWPQLCWVLGTVAVLYALSRMRDDTLKRPV